MPKGVISERERGERRGGEKCMGKLQWKNYSGKSKQMLAKLAFSDGKSRKTRILLGFILSSIN